MLLKIYVLRKVVNDGDSSFPGVLEVHTAKTADLSQDKMTRHIRTAFRNNEPLFLSYLQHNICAFRFYMQRGTYTDELEIASSILQNLVHLLRKSQYLILAYFIPSKDRIT